MLCEQKSSEPKAVEAWKVNVFDGIPVCYIHIYDCIFFVNISILSNTYIRTPHMHMQMTAFFF